MHLESGAFREVVERAPLVSIDLVVTDFEGRVLLGLRRNRPAQGYWFVPGGRIYKSESLDEAFARVAASELGRTLQRKDSDLIGVYEHHYQDSVFGEQVSTHYVVIAYALRWEGPLQQFPDGQHETFRWWLATEAQAHPKVHPYTKMYLSAGE